MKTIWIAPMLAACVLGCSSDLFRLRREGPAPLPPEPQKSIEHEESVRALADWSARMWRLVWARGVEKAAPAVGQAAEAAEAVSADLGAPVDPVPLADAKTWAILSEPIVTLKIHKTERGEYIRARDYYESLLDKYRAGSVQKTWSFGIPVLAPWLGLGLSGVVIFWLVRLVLKLKTAFWQVFLGVKGFLVEKPASGEELKDNLSKSMDQEAKDLVKQLYAKVGE